MEIPPWALSVSYWLHMLATVFWIGGLAAASSFTLPLIANLPSSSDRLDQLQRTQKRLDPLGWFSLLLLTATGLVQMSASDQYDGFLAFTNSWAQALLFKHLVFLGMVLVSGYLTWRALPELSRAVLMQSKGKLEQLRIEALLKKHRRLLTLNLVLGLLVLAFTALARVAA